MGFFEDAGIDINDVPDDEFGFGNDFWPVRIVEIGDAKVTDKGDKYGMMVKFILDHPKYATHWVQTKGLGNGNWYQLPVPTVLQEQGISWDPKNDEKQMRAMIVFRDLLLALGFKKDELSKVGRDEMLGKVAFAKIKPEKDENGYWRFRLNNMKPVPGDYNPWASGNGASEFTPQGTSNSEDVMKRAMMDDNDDI